MDITTGNPKPNSGLRNKKNVKLNQIKNKYINKISVHICIMKIAMTKCVWSHMRLT